MKPWAAWHLHLSVLGAAATDEVIRHVVGPAVDWCHERQTATEWFFVRYWQFGPHVRLRVAGLEPQAEQHLDQLLRVRLHEIASEAPGGLTPEEYRQHATFLAAAGEGGHALEVGELKCSGVYRQTYRPEVDRYGGPSLMSASESLFQEASELALAFVRCRPPEAARAGLGLRATRAALEALPDTSRRGAFCRVRAADWQSWQSSAATGGGTATTTIAPPGLLDARTPAPVRRWVEHLHPAMAAWRMAVSEDRADRILGAHIHMLHNRLGLSVSQELSHYLALAEALAPTTIDLVVAS